MWRAFLPCSRDWLSCMRVYHASVQKALSKWSVEWVMTCFLVFPRGWPRSWRRKSIVLVQRHCNKGQINTGESELLVMRAFKWQLNECYELSMPMGITQAPCYGTQGSSSTGPISLPGLPALQLWVPVTHAVNMAWKALLIFFTGSSLLFFQPVLKYSHSMKSPLISQKEPSF